MVHRGLVVVLPAMAIWGGMASCTREPQTARHTVAEYRANADWRREEIALCANNPGSLGRSADCVNAREADRLEGIGTVRGLPPVGLSSSASKK